MMVAAAIIAVPPMDTDGQFRTFGKTAKVVESILVATIHKIESKRMSNSCPTMELRMSIPKLQSFAS